MKELTIYTSDEIPLAVTLFKPEISNGKVLLINSATGVKKQIYFSFAKYLAENNFTVLTYDYRGIGASKPSEMRGFNASMRVWGTIDFKTLTNYIQQEYPHYTKFCLGHSVGALILGMNNYSKNFEKFIFVGTQDAYLRNLTFTVAGTALLGFGIALPLLSNVLGYFPAHRFGLGESLPKGVAFDWQTLILHKKSTGKLYEKIGKNISKELSQETFIIHAEDDTWVTRKGMRNLLENVYPKLQTTFREIKVSESDSGKIGHVNFFRSYNQKLWKIVLDEL